jgi:hypothetical protein
MCGTTIRDREVADDVGGEQVAEAVRPRPAEADGFGRGSGFTVRMPIIEVVDQHVDTAEAHQRALDARGTVAVRTSITSPVAPCASGWRRPGRAVSPAGEGDAPAGGPAHGEAGPLVPR